MADFSSVPRRYYLILHITGKNISHVCSVSSVLYKAEVILNLKKCEVFTEKADHLRHLVRLGKSELDGLPLTCSG